MMRRILVYAAVVILGAGAGAGGLFLAFHQGWIGQPKQQQQQQHISISADDVPAQRAKGREAVLTRLRQKSQTEPLRGTFVRDVTSGERLVVTAVIDNDSQRQALETEASAVLSDQGLDQAFVGKPTVEADVYPLRSQYLPELRKRFAEVQPRTWLKDLTFGDDGKVRVDAVVLGAVDAKTNESIRDEVSAQLKQRPGKEKWVPLVVAGKIDAVPLVASLQAEMDKNEQTKDAWLGNPSFAADGSLQLDVVFDQSGKRERGDLAAFLRGKLPAFAALPQAGQLKLKSAWIEREPLSSLRSFCVSSTNDLLKRTWLRKATFLAEPPTDRLVLRLEGVCVQPGPAETTHKELDRLLGDEARKKFDTVSVAIDAKGVQVRPNPAYELQTIVRKTPSLRGVLVNPFYFNDKGQLVVSYSFTDNPKTIARLNEMAGKLKSVQDVTPGVAPLTERKADSEEQEIAFQDEKKADEGGIFDRVAADVQKTLAKDPELRYTRIDGLYPANDDNGDVEITVSGVNVWAGDGKGVVKVGDKDFEKTRPDLKKLREVLQKEITAGLGKQIKKPIKVRLATESDGPAIYFRVLVNPAATWQNALADDKKFDGILLKRAEYDDKGSLVLTGLTASAEQTKEITARLKTLADDPKLAVVLGPLVPEDPDKEDSPLKVKPRASSAGLTTVPWQKWIAEVQKSLAKGKPGSLESHTRIERLVWRYVGPSSRIVAHGVCIHPGEAEKLKDSVRDTIKPLLDEKFTEAKDPAGVSRPLVAAMDVRCVAPSPLRTLREKAVGNAEWYGAVFDELTFDGEGKLSVTGIVADAKQRSAIKSAVEAQLSKAGVLQDKESVECGKMRELDNRMLSKKVQERFAEEAAPFKRTRVDLAEFRYHQKDKDEPVARLHVEGVCLGPSSDEKTLRARLLKDANAELQLAHELSDAELVTTIQFATNPARSLQEAVRKDESLRGVLFTDAKYLKNGALQISAAVPGDEMKEPAEKRIKGGEIGKDVRSPSYEKEPRAVVAEVRSMKWKSEKVNSWAGFMKALQKDLSSSDARTGRSLRQARLSGASFVYEKDRDKPVLLFDVVGVYNRLALLEADKELKEKVTAEKDEAARAKLVQDAVEKDLRKKALDALRDRLGKEAPTLLPGVDYNVEVSASEFVEVLAPALQKQLKNRKILLTGFEFDEDGYLRPLSDLPLTPANLDAIQKLLQTHAPKKLVRPARRDEKDDTELIFADEGAPDPEWQEMVWKWQEPLSTSDDARLRKTRLDQASLDYDDKYNVILLIEGCHLGDAANRATLQAEIKKVTKDSLGLKRDFSVRLDPVKFRFRADPAVALQSAVAARGKDKKSGTTYDGLLFYNTRYDASGTLRYDVLLGNSEQKALADEVVKDNPLPEDVLLGKPRDGKSRSKPERTTFAWKAMIQSVRKAFASGDGVSRRTRLDRAYFTYAKDNATVELNWEGVSLQPKEDEEGAAVRDAVKARLDRQRSLMPALKAGVKLDNRAAAVTTPGSPVRSMQEEVVKDRLDGVGVSDATFDADGKLVVSGIWNSAGQRDGMRASVGGVLARQRIIDSADNFLDECKTVRSDEILDRLRQWTADNLDETYVRRLYYSKDGVLTIEGEIVAEKDRDKVREQLTRLLNEHPQFRGRFGIERLAVAAAGKKADSSSFVSFLPAPPARQPAVELHLRKAAVPLLRARVQMSRDSDAELPPREFDGVMLRRGYFAASGEFVLEGLADNARQATRLKRLIAEVATDAPYNRAFGTTYVLKLSQRPLEPLLRRLRQVMPAYEELDGLILEGAGHDVDNRLMLRFTFVGRQVPAAATGTLFTQIKEDRRFQTRVDERYLRVKELDERAEAAGPVRVFVADRQAPRPALARKLIGEAIGTLRVGVGDLSVARCRDMDAAQVREYRLRHAAEAMRMADVALLHAPGDSTAWYVRSIAYQVHNDLTLVRRDLRRMTAIERLDEDGRARQAERLEMLEHVQGDFRRQLEAVRKKVALEMDKGVPPLQLSDLP